MPVSSSTEHWIKPDALTINLNHFGDPDYLQVSVLAGAVVMAFKQDVIGYNAAHNYRTWPLNAANTYLETTSAVNVYAKLTRSEVNAQALIAYDTVLRDIEGREITYAEDGSEILGEPSSDLYYVFLGQISASANSNGESVQREWTIDFRAGNLDTNQYRNEESTGEWNKMFRLNKVTDMIDVLKTISLAIFKKIVLEGKIVSDIKRSVDSDLDVPVSDDNLATSKYVEEKIEGMDDRYLSKIKDDRTPFKINIGDKFTAENDARLIGLTETDDVIVNESVHSKEFISGFTGGKGWAIRLKEYLNSAGVIENRSELEIDDVIVRGVLRVFEFIVSQMLGENDNRTFTAMLEVDHYDPTTGMVWLDTQGGKFYNPFRVDDIILVQQFNGMPNEENDYYITKQYELVISEVGVGDLSLGEDRLDWVKIRNFSSPMEGATEKLITKGDTFVRIDNLSNPDRKGIIQLMTVGADTPYMDIIYGKKTDPDNSLKGRFGNLKGVYNPLFGWLSDFGAYLTNLYAVGEFRIAHTGEDVADAIEMTKGAFKTHFKQIAYDITEEDNLLTNGVFAGDLSMWQLGETDLDFLTVDGKPVYANRNLMSTTNSFCGVDEWMGRNMMRIYDSKIVQLNGYIDQPPTHKEYEEGEDGEVVEKEKPNTLYLNVVYYCRKGGQIWVGFTDDSGNPIVSETTTIPNVSEEIVEGVDERMISVSGEWDGVGNFTISTTGDVYIDRVTLTDEPLENLKAEFSTRIEQDARRIALIAEKNTANESKLAELEITAEKISQTVVSVQGTATDAKSIANAAQSAADDAYTRANSAYSLADRAYDYAASNATTISQHANYISLWSGSFDSSGKLTSNSGAVLTSNFATLFSEQVTANELVKRAEISVYVDDAISNIQLTADKITIYGDTTINDIFKVSNGVITLGGFTVNNDSLTSTTTVLGSTMNMGLSAKNINFMYSDGLGAGVAMEAVFGPTSSYFSNEGTITAGVKIFNTAGKSSQQAGLLLNVSSGYNIYASGGSCFLLPSVGNLTRIQGLSLYGIRNTSGTLNSITDFILASGNVTLPNASTLPGKMIFVKMSGNYSVSSTSTIVKSSGSDTYTSESFNNRALFYISNGSRWYEFTCYTR